MNKIYTIISALCLALLVLVAPPHATIYFDDDFEGAWPTISNGVPQWSYNSGACGGSPCQWLNVSTEQAHSGSKSLRGYYPSGALTNEQGTWNQAISHGIPPTTDLYVRYWYRTAPLNPSDPNFNVFRYGPTTGTKHVYWKGLQGTPDFVSINWFGNRTMGFAGQVPNFNFYPNKTNVPFADNVWYCVEEHVKLNTPGQPDGIVEVWVNGTQTVRYDSSTLVNGAPCCTFRPVGNTFVFNWFEIYKQTGAGYMYYDQFAAGDTRVGGCGSTPPPPPDTTPPSVPGTTSTSVNGTTISLTIGAASTDAQSGVSSYSRYRCTGAACSPTTLMGTQTGLTFADAGLANSTTYGYCYRATNGAGLQSACNATAYATTGATTPPPPDSTPPSTPGAVTATVGVNTINLTIASASTDAESGVTGYTRYRCTGASCSPTAAVGTQTGLTFTDTGLAASTTYGYCYKANNGVSLQSACTATVYATTQAAPPPPDTTPPSPPTMGTPTTSGTSTSLNWSASVDNVGGSGVNLYTILFCTGAACTPSAVLGTTPPGTLNFVHNAQTPSTVYRYSVRANDVAGNPSAQSNIVEVTTAAPAIAYYTLLFTDSFTRADAGTLGASYQSGYTSEFGATTTICIVSLQVRPCSINFDAIQTYTTAVANDVAVEMSLPQVGGSGLRAFGLVTRMNDPSPTVQNGYDCRVFFPTTSKISKWVGGVYTLLSTVETSAWAADDIPRCETVGTTTSMYRVRAGVKTLMTSASDATFASGKVGIILYQATGTLRDLQIDNFNVYSVSSTPPVAPTIASATFSPTGAVVVPGAVTASAYRVVSGNNANTISRSDVRNISLFPGNVYTETWLEGVEFVCFFPLDAAGVEQPPSANAYVCGNPGAPPLRRTPSVLSSPFPTGDRPAGSTSATFGVTVTPQAACRWDTVSTTTYDEMPTANQMDVANSIASFLIPSGLTNGSSTLRYIRCNYTNSADEQWPNLTSQLITITVASSTADVTLPTTPLNLVATPVLNSTVVTLIWAPSTDAGGINRYNVYESSDNITYVLAGSPVTTTSTQRNAPPNTIVYYKVSAVDNSNNEGALSIAASATTYNTPDIEPPSDMTGLGASPSRVSVNFYWTAGTDNRGAPTATIEYCQGAACTDFASRTTNTLDNLLTIDLLPSTFYRARGKFCDQALPTSNCSAYTPIIEFTTDSGGLDQPRKIGGARIQRFPSPGGTIAYPLVPGLALSTTYTVKVGNVNVPVQSYGGHSFAWFSTSSNRTPVTVTVSETVSSYTLSPLRNPTASSSVGNTIRFDMPLSKKLVVHKVNSISEKLFLFNDAPEINPPFIGGSGVYSLLDYGADNTGVSNIAVPLQNALNAAAGGGTVFVPAGLYTISSEVTVPANVTVYLAPGSVIQVGAGTYSYFTPFIIQNVNTVSFTGRGVIYGRSATDKGVTRLIQTWNGTNFTIKDIMLLDSWSTAIRLGKMTNSAITNLKVLSAAPGLSDGIDLAGVTNGTISDSFIFSSDDSLVVGSGNSIYAYGTPTNTDGLTISGNLIYQYATGHALSFVPVVAPQLTTNVTFENNDIIDVYEGLSILLANVVTGGWGEVSNVRFANSRFENIRYQPIFMDSEDFLNGGWGGCPNGFCYTDSGFAHDIVFDHLVFSTSGTVNSGFYGRDAGRNINIVNFNAVYMDGTTLVTNAATGFFSVGSFVTNLTYTNNP